MPIQVAQPPSSPSGSALSSAKLASNLFSPSRSSPRGLQASPGSVEVDAVVAGGNGSIAGPASPGRVRRVGGLREVREKIRKALGEV